MKQNILGNKMELIRIKYKEQINKTVSLVVSKVGGLIKKTQMLCDLPSSSHQQGATGILACRLFNANSYLGYLG